MRSLTALGGILALVAGGSAPWLLHGVWVLVGLGSCLIGGVLLSAAVSIPPKQLTAKKAGAKILPKKRRSLE